MARLEIEIAATNTGAPKAINETTDALSKLQSQHSKIANEIAKVTAVSNGLEQELRSLTSQFKQGAISESVFNKESLEVSQALSSARVSATQYQGQLASLNATIKQNVTGQNQYGNSVKKLQGYHQDFSKGIRGSTTVALEFGRIIQDAPYGIQGVANNIQQLTTNLGYYVTNAKEAAAASGQVLTTTQLAGSIFRSLLTPMSLITIAVSAITVGWQLYSKSAAKTAKENEKLANSTKEYVDTLEAVRGAQLKGVQNAQSEIASLEVLYRASQDETKSKKDRLAAIDEIQNKYPAYFQGLTTEAILAGKARQVYLDLRVAILATAQARAVEDSIAKKSGERLTSIQRNIDLVNNLNKSTDKLAKAQAVLRANQEAGINSISAERAVNSAYNEREAIVEKINKLSEDRGKIDSDINNLLAIGVDLQGKGVIQADKITKSTKARSVALTDYGAKLDEILSKSSNQADLSLLTGLDSDIEKTRQKYEDLYKSIKALEEKAVSDKKLSEAQKNAIVQKASDARVIITANEIKEQEANVVKNAEKVNDIAFQYTRRLNESRTQALTRQLNAETKLKLESLSGDTAAQLRLQEEYYKKIEELSALDRQNKVELAFDGSAISTELELINQDLIVLRQQFESGLGVDVFRDKVQSLEIARQQFTLMKQGIDGVSGALGTLSTDIIFNADEAFKNLGKTFESLVGSIIGGLIKIGAQYLINQLIATSSFAAIKSAKEASEAKNAAATVAATAATTAASIAATSVAVSVSTAAAATVASAWSTAAALVSAATFGASAVAGGVALSALIASTKGLAATGFASGGYTGNIGTNKVAGVVHGREYVINAAATARHKGLLESINSGTFTGVSSSANDIINSGGSGNNTFIADSRIEGSDIVISYRRAAKDLERYGS